MTRPVLLLGLLLLFASTLHALTFSSSHQLFAFRGGASNKNDAETSSPPKAKGKTKPRKRSKKTRSKPQSDTASSSESNTSSSNPIMEEVLKHDDFYKVLGTTKEQIAASKNPDKEIQKAYRKRAVHTHPDKTGGNRSAFDKVAEAYEGLQDAGKRQLYDRYGKEGAQQHAQGGGMNAEDLFRRFFGGSRNPFADAFGQQQQRGPAMYIYDVSLEALYHGLTRTVQLPDGQNVAVTVPAGSHDSDVIQNSDNESVCFRLRTTQHGHFVRKGHDLAVELRISLAEALTGVQRKIRHLNGQALHVVSAATGTSPAPIRTGDVQVLPGYGMPKDADSKEFGDLYIQYEVVPVPASSRLTDDERRELKRLLLKVEGKPSKGPTAEWPFQSEEKAKQSTTMQLQKSSASAFGASYTRPRDPFANDFNPFGGGGGFFFQGF